MDTLGRKFGKGDWGGGWGFQCLLTGLLGAAWILCTSAGQAQTVYTWNGSASSDFSNSANWNGGNIAPTNNAPNPLNARITVANGSNYPLIYTSDQGNTLYAASGGGTSDRSLFIATGTNASMEIQGGIFESQAVGADGIANGATGSLTINGGEYRNINGSGAKTFLVVFGGGGTGTLTIQSGTFAVHTLKFGDSGSQTGTGRVYLNGGTLSVGTILDSGNATSYLYLNDGILQARATTEFFLNGLDNVFVQAGGARIDTQANTINIPLALQHDPALGSNPDGGLTKTGSGTLKLSAANSYTGVTTVSAGTIQIQHAQALGTTDGGTTVASGARLELAGGITVSGESLTISGAGGNNIGALQSASGVNTWAGPITLAANDTRIGANGSGQVLIVSGTISDGGNNYNLIVRNADGGGETILSGANTYGGATRVLVGVLKIDGADNRLPTASPLQIGNSSNVASALFDLNGYNQQVTGLVSEGSTMSMTLTNSSATASTLTIQNTTDRTYGGVLSGNLSLVKQGSAMQTLSGSSANTYTGTTTVNAGRLHLSKSSNVVAVPGDLVISGGAVTFGANDQIADTATVTVTSGVLNGTGVITNHRNNHIETFANLILGGSGVFNTGDSTWTITGQGTVTGGSGAIFVGNSGCQLSFGSLTVTGMTATAGGTVGTLNSFTIYGNTSTRRSTLLIGSGGLTLNGSKINLRRGSDSGVKGSRLVLDGDVTTTGTSVSSIVEDTAGGAIGQIGIELSSTAGSVTRTFNIGGGGADLTITIPISNGAATTAGIVKTGSGTLILSAANTYTGGTTVQAGRLLVNNTTGSGTGTGNVLVQGGLLGGNGIIAGSVQVDAAGTLSAGNSPGHLTILGNYTQAGTLLVELAGYTQGGTQAVPGQWATNGYDWVSVGGSAVLDGNLQIDLLAGFQPASGDVFNVLTAANGITDGGLQLQWDPQDLLPAQYWTYRIISGQGSEQILQLQLAVPEPTSLVLLLLGGAGLLLVRRRLVASR